MRRDDALEVGSGVSHLVQPRQRGEEAGPATGQGGLRGGEHVEGGVRVGVGRDRGRGEVGKGVWCPFKAEVAVKGPCTVGREKVSVRVTGQEAGAARAVLEHACRRILQV